MTISQKELKEFLVYCPDTGIFTWAKSRRGVNKDDIAGTLSDQGYIKIALMYKKYRAHHLAFLYMTGSFPPNQVDHINRIRDDNRWNNLRLATAKINARNRGKAKNNKSSTTGVNWCNTYQKWRVTIGKTPTHVGYFKTQFSAVYARHYAELLGGYHPTHGK